MPKKKKSTLKNWNKWVNLLLWKISWCWSYYFKILGALTSMIMSQGWILWSILTVTREWPLLDYFLTLCVILMLRSISCSEWRPCSWSWIKKIFPEVQGLIFITDLLWSNPAIYICCIHPLMNYIFLLVFFNFLGRKWIQWNIRCDIDVGCCLIPGLCLFLSCPVLVGDFITATIHHEQKVRWGGKGLFNSHFHIDVHHWRKSQQELKHGRILEAGTDAVAMEGSCLVTCFPWLFSFLSYRTQDH